MRLTEVDFPLHGGYYPSAPDLPPPELQNTIKAGKNCWLRPLGKIDLAFGLGDAMPATPLIGARAFAINSDRAEIAGGLVSNRIPFAGMIRFENAVLFFLSELTSKQVYINEVAVTGLVTSSTAGRLRIAVPNGSGGYDVYDAGTDAPVLPPGNVTIGAGGTKSMTGSTGVAVCSWRPMTNAISPPSALVYKSCVPSSTDLFAITLPTPPTGWPGWVLCGTRWGDQGGDIRALRYIRQTPRGTFTANGTTTITGDADARFLQDLAVGNTVTIAAVVHTIATVVNDQTATTAAPVAAGSSLTMTISAVTAEWYNGELGSLIDRDALKPPKAAGVFQFAGRVFLWGTTGDPASSTGSCITPMLDRNPEHVGTFNIISTFGDDLLNVLAGDQRLYLLTRNTIEIVTFTGDADEPYRIRVAQQPGVQSPTAAAVYKDQLYFFDGQPGRTRIDKNVDNLFGAPVMSDMTGWLPQNVTIAIDPSNEAVLYCHRAADPFGTTTTIIPFMPQLAGEPWGPPHEVDGYVVDHTVANGVLYLVIKNTSGEFYLYEWEGGTGAEDSFVASQYRDFGSSATRKVLKRITFTGQGSDLSMFAVRPGAAIPSLTSLPSAEATFTLSGSDFSEEQIYTHVNGFRAAAMRVDFPQSGSSWDDLSAHGYGLEEMR